jgi:glucokinase
LKTLDSRTISTPDRDSSGKSVVTAIKNLSDELKKSFDLQAVGLAVPGTLDEPQGVCRWAGNLDWRDVPIVSMLEKEVQLPIAFKHDVRAGALAELKSGAMKGYRDGIFLPIGTGIACAIVLDGEIKSAAGFAGEIGHVKVNSSRPCVCGNVGCLEATSSTLAISKEYELRSGKRMSTDEIVSSIDIDTVAKDVFNEAVLGIVDATETLATLLAPEIIVLGGGLSMSGNKLIDALRLGISNRLTFQRKPILALANYGIHSGMYGCGMIAWEKLDD